MAEIGQLPPACRVPPSLPAKGTGQGDRAPQRKPERRQPDQRRQPRDHDDDGSGIDEYA